MTGPNEFNVTVDMNDLRQCLGCGQEIGRATELTAFNNEEWLVRGGGADLACNYGGEINFVLHKPGAPWEAVDEDGYPVPPEAVTT